MALLKVKGVGVCQCMGLIKQELDIVGPQMATNGTHSNVGLLGRWRFEGGEKLREGE